MSWSQTKSLAKYCILVFRGDGVVLMNMLLFDKDSCFAFATLDKTPKDIGLACGKIIKNIVKFFFIFIFRFPLHDKERLEKWLKNMKRDSWVPSKYQFLCSDHFTPDSLDIRWGIRYLKQTAIPTIFSLPEDCQVLELGVEG